MAVLDIAPASESSDNPSLLFLRTDITQQVAVKEAVQEVMRRFRQIDVLVNNAYPRNKNYGRKFEEVELADFNENVTSHLGGYFNVTQQVSRQMVLQKRGSIINIGSIYGMVGPDFSIYQGTDMTMPVEYAAIKGGLLNFTRYLATYLARHEIRVNAVSPGGIFNHQDPQFVENYKKKVPMGRMAEPGDIVGAVLFLASDASRYITGQNLAVDGGWTTH